MGIMVFILFLRQFEGRIPIWKPSGCHSRTDTRNCTGAANRSERRSDLLDETIGRKRGWRRPSKWPRDGLDLSSIVILDKTGDD